MTKYITDPYSLADEYTPKPKIRRSATMPSVLTSAAEAGGMLGQARQARQAPDEFVNYEMDLSPYQDAPPPPRQPKGYNPFMPSAQQGYPPMRPPMEMPTTASAAAPQRPPSFMETTNWSGSAAGDEAERQRQLASRPVANAIFRPQPVTGGRPDNVADNVARETIARAAIAQATGDPNAEALMDQAATLAWQREAAVNGNVRGDIAAPKDYIESWKGQVRAGGEGSPFADMFNRATAAARQVMSQQQGQQIRSQTQPIINATNAQVGRLTQPRSPSDPSYGTARGGASSEVQSTTRRLPAPMVDESLITRVMSGGRLQQPSGPMVIDRTSQATFMNSFATAAEKALAAKGLPTSLAPILAAIPVNEQGHKIEAPGNNYYGIKGKNPRTGASRVSNTWEEEGGQRVNQQAEFRAYDSPEESVQDFISFLESNPRYADAMEIGRRTGDPEQFIRAIHKAGYATDSNWSDQVLSIASQVKPSSQRPMAAPAQPASRIPANDDYGMVERIMANARQQKPAASSSSLDVGSIVKEYAGKPYVFGGAGGRSDMTPGAATDCSGFVASVWKNKYGVDLAAHTDTSYNQLRQMGAPEIPLKDARPNDIVYYMGAGTGGAISHHMGIYAGDGKVLDMSVSGGEGVRTRDVGHAGKFVILRDPRVKG